MLLTVRLLGRLGPSTSSSINNNNNNKLLSVVNSSRFKATDATPARSQEHQEPSSSPLLDNNNKSITIDDSCLERLKQILDKPSEEFLRIQVETGGCSGFSYEFDVDTRHNLDPEEDLVFARDSYQVVINKHILAYMQGATIEYNESLIKSSFQVKNPQAQTKCSCGASFSIDLNQLKSK